MSSDFKTDNNGNVITKPVTGYTAGLVANTAVILAIEFLTLGTNDPQTVDQDSIQFVLTPPQCLELSDVLARAAAATMAQTVDPNAPVN
jgi:hypothetical protein